jgi:hypothetical protein
VVRINPSECRNDYSYYRHRHRDGGDCIGFIGSASGLQSRVFSGARNIDLLCLGGISTPFQFLIFLGKPFNRERPNGMREAIIIDIRPDGGFPHSLKIRQLLAIVVHKVIYLLPVAPAQKRFRLLLKRARLR